jgi:hypothetical protein
MQSSVASLIPSPSESAETVIGIIAKTSMDSTNNVALAEPMPFPSLLE